MLRSVAFISDNTLVSLVATFAPAACLSEPEFISCFQTYLLNMMKHVEEALNSCTLEKMRINGEDTRRHIIDTGTIGQCTIFSTAHTVQ